MMPLRAARSSRLTALRRSSAVAVGAFALLSAVRSADRCARLRTVAARAFRMFFFADAIFGTSGSPEFLNRGSKVEPRTLPVTSTDVKAAQLVGPIKGVRVI